MIPLGLQKYWLRLLTNLRISAPLLVSFSGGVDSSLLLRAAIEVIRFQDLVAVSCIGPFMPIWELNQARALANKLKITFIELDADELDDPLIKINDYQRCYYCKRRRFFLLTQLAKKLGFKTIADGSHIDDKINLRPGIKATIELGIFSPLKVAGLNKLVIRSLSRALGLATANVPSNACLATRIPTNTPLSFKALKRICKIENSLRNFIPGKLRVRDYFPLAHLEIEKQYEITLNEFICSKILILFKQAGYSFFSLDLKGHGIKFTKKI